MTKRSPFTYAAPDPFADLLDGLPVEATYTITATTDLPARLYGGNAQAVEVGGLDYILHLDLSKLPESEAPTSNDGKWTVVWDEPNNIYKRVEFTSLPGGVGPSSTYIGDQPPNDPTEGQLWWESDSGQMFIWYTDANSLQWVPATIQPSNVMGGVGTLGNVYDTIHIARLTIVPAELKTITLSGYNRPGDAGPAMPCRRTAAMVTHHKGVFRTADRFTDAGFEDAANGGWWEYIGNNGPIWTEWFGAQGDAYITDQIDGGTLPNPSPTDNRQAILDATQFMWTYGGDAAIAVGPAVQIGYGAYYCSDDLVFDRTICIQGLGLGYYHDSACSRLIFAAGKRGLYFRYGSGPYSAAGSRVRDLFIDCLGFGGQTDKHGIEMDAAVMVENCSIRGFGGNGIDITANAPGTNANGFYISHCAIYGNANDGVFAVGGDANVGIGIALNCMSNGRWGINDQSFLANSWYACHTSGNGNIRTGYGGPYRGAFAPCIFSGCYSESDQAKSFCGPLCAFDGGFHGAGIFVEQGQWRAGNLVVGGLWLDVNDTDRGLGDDARYRLRDAANALWRMSKRDALHSFVFKYVADQGYLLEYDNNPYDNSYGVTPADGSMRRDPRIPANRFMLPQGTMLGGTWDQMRWLKFANAPLADSNQHYYTGDIALDMGGRQAGWMCTASGITTAAWVSGTTYALNSFVRNAGKVYECTRVPYDPDAWTRPPFTVHPTHTVGTVTYPEPNPHIDPGEAATIPGYTWTPIPYDPSYYTFAEAHGMVFNLQVEISNPDTLISYRCLEADLPAAPTPIFNTPWAMPASTAAPVHGSGTVTHTEPNPSPSGTEPATIPGYVWRYVTSNPVAKWAGFGDLFLDAEFSWAPPPIANGAASAVVTVAVPGAVWGDFAEATAQAFSSGGMLGLEAHAWVSEPDVVSVQLHNRTGASVTPGLWAWFVRVRKRTAPL